MKVLQGKTAFITGGASGIGLGIATTMVAAGMRVVLADLRPDHIETALTSFRERGQQESVHAIRLDVTDRTAMSAAADETERVFGKLHVLVNNAGVGIQGPFKGITYADWDFGLAVNLGGEGPRMRGRHRFLTSWLAIVIATLWVDGAVASSKRAVVELFTSQGCSSCPPADALAGQLATIPALLVLSFHVTYWDGLAWKDPFSSKASTDRQYDYLRSLGGASVFTPQLIVNGARSAVGSQVTAVKSAIAAADQESFSVKADLEKQPDGSFKLTLEGPAQRGDVWAVEYVRHSLTKVRGGENGGRNLETFNDVTRIQRLGDFNPGTLNLQPLTGKADGLAILVQAPHAGRILGAAAY